MIISVFECMRQVRDGQSGTFSVSGDLRWIYLFFPSYYFVRKILLCLVLAIYTRRFLFSLFFFFLSLDFDIRVKRKDLLKF